MTSDDISTRLDFAEEMLLLGKPTKTIVKEIQSVFRVSRSCAFEDVKRTRRRCARRAEKFMTKVELRIQFGLAVRRLEMLFAKALKDDDIALALRACEQQCKLLGLYPEDRRGWMTAEEEDFESMTDAELETIIRRGKSKFPLPAAEKQHHALN